VLGGHRDRENKSSFTAGITESGYYRVETVTDHHVKDLDMTQTKQDIYLFFKHAAEKLIGLSGAFVDDLVRAGNLQFKQSSQNITENRFDIKPTSEDEFKFAGSYIETHDDHLQLSQREFIRRFRVVPDTCDYESFRTVRAKLQWASHSRSNIFYCQTPRGDFLCT
jgi:hypothetical protein